MPPVRTPSARAGKSERTHEENVERAFIAASRRCDRTLEARVESARKASEIHKARTGRGLRITEKDVQNEEMYEEEDDDLPLQYRHLTAGFQTSSPEFNRRFAAYLTTHVAIRTALEQSIMQSYQQQEEHQQQQQQQQQQSDNGAQHQIRHQQYEMFPSPFLSHQTQQSQRTMSSVQGSQGSPINRYSPYPILPRTSLPTMKKNPRSPSTPCITESNPEGPPTAILSSTSNHSSETRSSISSPLKTSFTAEGAPQSLKKSNNENSQSQVAIPESLDLTSFGPLSTALPVETQAFLGTNIGFGDSIGDVCNSINNINNKPISFGLENKGPDPSSVQLKPEAQTTSAGLDMTLMPESSQDSPYLFGAANYFDDALRTDGDSLTPTSDTIDENDWRCFIDQSDSWLFSE